MRNIWRKAVTYFFVSIIFVSAIALAISISLTSSLKASSNSNEKSSEKFQFPESSNFSYPVESDYNSNYFYCWVDIARYIDRDDLRNKILNINHYYDLSIPLINSDELKKELCQIIKHAISQDIYFQKIKKKLKRITVNYKVDDYLRINCLFTYGEEYKNKEVWYYDQFSVIVSII